MQIAAHKEESKAWEIERKAFQKKIDWYETYHQQKFSASPLKEKSVLEDENARLKKKII